MILSLAAALFFADPAPLDMPPATGYLVSAIDGVRRFEDRFDAEDLWLAETTLGRWIDDDERVFTFCRLDWQAPAIRSGDPVTRSEHASAHVTLDRRDDAAVFDAVTRLSPVVPTAEFAKPRQMPRGYREVRYYQGTNTDEIVCAFLPEKTDRWYLAIWDLSANDLLEDSLKTFEDAFLGERVWTKVPGAESIPEVPKQGRSNRHAKVPAECELLRADARHSVTAYSKWHATDADGLVILDDLPLRDFVVAFTNDQASLRKRYAEVMPSPLDGTNVLCVARLYADRSEYLDALELDGKDLSWSAAYWCPSRRELVAYLPHGGENELLRTLRHEAFHQYLSYACSMMSASPWLNEGYAQYFEDEKSIDWELPDGTAIDVEQAAEVIPAIMRMDYDAFYSGTDHARRLKYRLAWSIAVFLEKGAPNVRFRPFANVKRDYIESLLDTHDPVQSTERAFGNADKLKLFIAEWKAFWKNT